MLIAEQLSADGTFCSEHFIRIFTALLVIVVSVLKLLDCAVYPLLAHEFDGSLGFSQIVFVADIAGAKQFSIADHHVMRMRRGIVRIST